MVSTNALFAPLRPTSINKPTSIEADSAPPAGLPSLSDADFSTSSHGLKGLSVVLFTSEWCGPCKTQRAVIEQLMGAFQLEKDCFFGAVDTDSNPVCVEKFNIRSIPSTAFLMNGELVGEIVGAVPKAVVVNEITRLMNNIQKMDV